MGLSIWLYPFLFFIFQMQFAYRSTKALSFSPPPPHPHNHFLCPYEQSLTLLQFKQQFSINNSTHASRYCDYYGQSSQPKTMSWNSSTDCCKWEGVTCDWLTGDVIGLDLSCSQLNGTIHSSSTLFQLSHLKRLNLAFNSFYPSTISHRFGQFASLTHLNLSHSAFNGSVPSQISHLSNLVSLDLSYLYDIKLETNNFEMLLQNLTQLRELSLSYVDISSAKFPVNLSSSLTLLDLSETGLHGNLPNQVLQLPNLQILRLFDNPGLTIPTAANVSSSSPLRRLDLSYCNFSGTLPPEWLGNLTQLTYLSLSLNNFSGSLTLDVFVKLQHLSHLDLSSNNFNGPFPSSITNLTQLVSLDLSHNSLTGTIPSSIGDLTQFVWLDLSYNSLTGDIPSSIGNLTQLVQLGLLGTHLTGAIPSSIGKLTQLVDLHLSSILLTGDIPSSIGNLTQLQDLDLSSNSLTGSIPFSISNLTQLTSLDLSNNSLTGPIPSNAIGLQNLTRLYLSENSLNGTIPSWLFAHPSLQSLDLASNQLSGSLEEFPNYSVLVDIDFSNNHLHGHIPHSISKLVTLQDLDLSRNHFTGILGLNMFSNLTNLQTLDLSYNNLSVTTNNIHINATLPQSLSVVRLSSCKLKEFPYLLLSTESIQALDLRQNFLQGPLPFNICNLTHLQVLDLSYNNLGGEILPCLGNFNDYLSVLNLQNNNFHGSIPTTFAEGNKFRNLNFNGNQLGGKLPRSLATCKQLEVLDLGNNHLNDTFPAWLGTLPELKVLVLKSNIFHGSIPNTVKTKSPFRKLRIIDLSNNEFSGLLPSKYFTNFESMMKVGENTTKLEYMRDEANNYEDSVTLVIKGTERVLERILTIFTTIDMSKNNFEGEIPNFIGNLISLRELNLSHNKLVRSIPPSLGRLSVLESLDLSFNQLEGEIPQLLTDLTSLEVLNLSQNHLVGQIPRGKQFNTFDNGSYGGNSALCGFPLSKDCEGDDTLNQLPPPKLQEDDDSDFENGFTWKVVCLGYGCGTIFGLVMGYLMFSTGKPKWLIGLVENYRYKNGTKRGRQRRNKRRN